jgi:hypothetical protein
MVAVPPTGRKRRACVENHPSSGRKRRIVSESFETIRSAYEASARSRCNRNTPFVKRLGAYMKHTRITRNELYSFWKVMKRPAAANCVSYPAVAKLVADYGTHLDSERLPFTRLFGIIVQFYSMLSRRSIGSRTIVARNLLYGGLSRLFKAGKSHGVFSWRVAHAIYYPRALFAWLHGHLDKLHDLAVYLDIICSSYTFEISFLRYSIYSLDRTEAKPDMRFAIHNMTLPKKILEGWKSARYFVSKYQALPDNLLYAMGNWHRNQTWPNQDYREVSYTFLSRLKYVGEMNPSIHIITYYQSALPLIVYCNIRFRILNHWNVRPEERTATHSFVEEATHYLKLNHDRMAIGWTTLVRSILFFLLGSSPDRLAAVAQPLVVHNIMSFLCAPKRDISQFIVQV